MQTEEMLETARKNVGLDQFDDYSFLEGLEVAARAVRENVKLTPEEKVGFFNQYSRWLGTRLQISDYINRHPAVLSKPISKPIFILGLPRTGSTVLANLLSLDSRHRSPLRWEIADPVPPVSHGMLHDDPRCLALIDKHGAGDTRFQHIHYEAWDGPTECHQILAQDFKSSGIETPIASEIYGEWLLKCDTVSTYRYHKKFLQVLQANVAGRWVLKLPSHALNVQYLLKVYPDAKLVWTHRDPYTAVASFMGMAAVVQRFFRKEADLTYIKNFGPRRLHHHVQRLMDLDRTHGEDTLFHLFYEDLVRNPIKEVKRLYGWLGEELPPDVERRMSAWLKDNRQHKYGSFTYGFSNFDMDAEEVKPLFEEYAQRYSLAQAA